MQCVYDVCILNSTVYVMEKYVRLASRSRWEVGRHSYFLVVIR